MQKYELNHVRHDPMHCLAPGLFRALQRGERRTTKLDVVYEFGQSQRVEFSGPEPLGADDLRVLQGLVALAGLEGRVLSSAPKSALGVTLRQMLEPRWEATGDNAIVVQCSYRRLAHEIGYVRVDCSKPLKACIERLWKVSIIVQSGEQRRGFRLLADYRSSEELQGVHVALNPLLTNAVLGTERYIRISMDEVRAIKTEATRLIHQRLCAWINIGSSRKVQLVTLCDYLYPHGASANGATTRKRLVRVRQALSEMTNLGWQVEEYAKGRLEIRRPPINSHTPPY